MEAIARVRNLRGSARKARLVLDLIRDKSVPEAQKILALSQQKAAYHIKKLLNAAIANAQQKEAHVNTDDMFVSKAFADEGPVMKRTRPRAQGRATMIRKKTCHITLEISEYEEGEDNGSES